MAKEIYQQHTIVHLLSRDPSTYRIDLARCAHNKIMMSAPQLRETFTGKTLKILGTD